MAHSLQQDTSLDPFDAIMIDVRSSLCDFGRLGSLLRQLRFDNICRPSTTVSRLHDSLCTEIKAELHEVRKSVESSPRIYPDFRKLRIYIHLLRLEAVLSACTRQEEVRCPNSMVFTCLRSSHHSTCSDVIFGSLHTSSNRQRAVPRLLGSRAHRSRGVSGAHACHLSRLASCSTRFRAQETGGRAVCCGASSGLPFFAPTRAFQH